MNIDAGGVSSTTKSVLPVASQLQYVSALWYSTACVPCPERKNEPAQLTQLPISSRLFRVGNPRPLAHRLGVPVDEQVETAHPIRDPVVELLLEIHSRFNDALEGDSSVAT